jgi:pimeloyl-ACP methyl ester carboxylesterase
MRLNNPVRHPFRVPPVEKPLSEGRFHLPGGRRIGYAEYGDPSGAVVLWFHGTPGARRQFPLIGRHTAADLGLRIVVVERPGSGLSDPHPYGAIAEWATDMADVADALGADRVGVVGLSGGGPRLRQSRRGARLHPLIPVSRNKFAVISFNPLV